MLLLKLIAALSVYQHYCVGKYILSVDYGVGIEIYGEDLETTDDEFTANSHENEITDDELTADSYEKYITDDEFTKDYYEILIPGFLVPDDVFTKDSYENYRTDDELTKDFEENEITDDELTKDFEENEITDDELTKDFEENEITDDELLKDFEENVITDDELTKYFDENEITDDELTKDFEENEITDDELTKDFEENEITDDELTKDFEENEITDDELTKDFDEHEIIDDEFTKDSYGNYRTVDELTKDFEENEITDDELTTKPDENTTTDGELTTKPDENPTTDSALTTKPDENPTTESGECPPDKSRISKNDIRRLVDSQFIDRGLNKSMIEDIVPKAKEVNKQHSEDFNQFLNWFQSQPDHLKDVLQGLATVKERRIEPEAQKIADILKEYPQVEENIKKEEWKFLNLSKKLDKLETFCKYQCEDHEPEPNRIFKRSITEDYLCISIDDLREQVTKELEDNFEGFLNKTKENLHNRDQTFTETIKNIKDELNRGALKEFGPTMYNVLNLQKDYHRFVNKINSTNTENLIYAIKDRELKISSKQLELKKLFNDYKVYCSHCNKGPVKRSVRQTNLVINENENSKVSIIHELIEEKYIKTENVLNEIIDETFKNLNELINDPQRRETYLNDLKLREPEIIEVANKERLDLEHLKSIASLETIEKLSDLDSESNKILKNIDEKVTHLKEIIK